MTTLKKKIGIVLIERVGRNTIEIAKSDGWKVDVQTRYKNCVRSSEIDVLSMCNAVSVCSTVQEIAFFEISFRL